MIDPAMQLPQWLSDEQWADLVTGARERGDKTIKVDTITRGLLDTFPPHPNRRRLDMYYCPDCGCRVGRVGELCGRCAEQHQMERAAKQEAEPPAPLREPKFCTDCGLELPSYRLRVGRCDTCKRKASREAARNRKEQERKRCLSMSRF